MEIYKLQKCQHNLLIALPFLSDCESLTLLSCVTFLLSYLYVQSFKREKACVTGLRFALRLVYALITTWVALTGYKAYFYFFSLASHSFLKSS